MDKRSQPVLDIDAVSVEIGGAPPLTNISLSVLAGEVLALVGPNGAGKSTLLRAVSGEQKLQIGSVRFHGRDIDQWPQRDLAKHLAVLPQQSILEFPFTSREVVALSRTPHDTGSSIDAQVIDDVLSYLDVTHLAERLYTQLSGGEQQRVQLARVLAQIWLPLDQPRLLILDEPSSYFDLAHQQLLVKLVREIAGSDVAVLVVLHDLNLAMSCADSIAILQCGKLYACGDAEKVLNKECIQQVFGVQAKFIEDTDTGRKHLLLELSETKPLRVEK